MSLYKSLNAMNFKEKQDLVDLLSRQFIKDPKLSQETVVQSLSTLETILSLNASYDFNKTNLIIDNEIKYYVQKALEAYFQTNLKYIYLSNHPSDVLGVSLAIALESNLQTVVLLDDFSMNYGKSFESLIQINNYKPNMSIIFFDPLGSLFNEKPAANLWINSLRMSNTYTNFKKDLKHILSNPVGMPVLETLSKVKEGFKGVLVEPSVFSQFGFNYHGPLSGEGIAEKLRVFKNLKDLKGMHLIHINSNLESLKNLKLPSFKTEDALPENYMSYLDAIDATLSEYSDILVCADISRNKEHLAEFAIKFPDHYYVSTGTIQSFIDFAKGLSMLNKRVVFVVNSYQFKHVIPLVEEQLNNAQNLLFILRDSGLNDRGNRIKQGVFDMGHSALITNNIYMGKDINEAVSILRTLLNTDHFDLSILRIPSTSEAFENDRDEIDLSWDTYEFSKNPKAVIISYGPSFQSIYNKIRVNHLDYWLVNAKSVFHVDSQLIDTINEMQVPVIIYDLEDIYHTLYGVLKPLLKTKQLYNYNLKHTDLNLKPKDLKMKYHLNVEHILNVIE